jgi:hypothetical protein
MWDGDVLTYYGVHFTGPDALRYVAEVTIDKGGFPPRWAKLKRALRRPTAIVRRSSDSISGR